MFTRKQRWRRTRTRKNAWGDLPPEVLDAMLGGVGMPKSVSWDHSYAAALKIRADKAAEVARRAAKEDSRVKAAAASVAATRGGRVDPGQMPRSVSCSSLGPKRTLFARSSSKEGLERGAPRRGSSAANMQQSRRHMLPHRRGVSFNTQVKMVLIPKREEFSDAERNRLWWGREDYGRFRQVLIDWKRANAHRISQSDNILSINLSDIDDDLHEEPFTSCPVPQDDARLAAGPGYNRAHDEAAAAADATAAAAAAAAQAAAEAAKAAAAAAITAQANAAATAAAAAAATAAEVAAHDARELERKRAEAYASAMQQQEQQLAETKVPAPPAPAGSSLQHDESGGDSGAAADAWEVEMAKAKAEAMAAAVAAAGGGVPGGLGHEYPSDESDGLSDIAEGNEGQEERVGDFHTDQGVESESGGGGGGGSGSGSGSGKHVSRASFTLGLSSSPRTGVPDWSATGGGNGTFPLRRALTFGQTGQSPPSSSSAGGRLKAVPLSEAQAMAESLRAWRKNFGLTSGDGDGDGDGDDDFEEDRGRAMSLQQQTRDYAKRGRATALVNARTKWASDVVGGAIPGAAAAAQTGGTGRPGAAAAAAAAAATAAASAAAVGRGGGSVGGDGAEKQLRNLSDQDERSVFLASPVMAAFERESQTAAGQAEIEEAKAARAAAMVKAAAAERKQKPASGGGGGGDGGLTEESPGDAAAATASGAASSGATLQLGLNDAPGSAAAASAAGLRIATDGVSNLSLRARDSVENLQELGEHSWGPLPLSSSA